jgi:hypothetical protein
MDFKEIKNTKHYLYDSKEEFTLYHTEGVVRHNWRHGEEGEWVFTDDGFVCQILRKSKIKEKNRSVTCIRTVCGTFMAKDMNKEMLGENGIADNIYTFSGNNISQEEFNKRGRTSKELMFAKYAATGMSIIEAYKLAYPDAKSDVYIRDRCEKLLKTERIDKMIDKEIRRKLEEEGVTDNWLIERYKTIADMAESDTAKLRSLDSLSKISGLFEINQSKSEKLEIWAGFTPKQLKEVKEHGKPEIIAHAERIEKDEED